MEVKAEVTEVDELLEDIGEKGRKGERGLQENTSQTREREGSHSKHQLLDLDKGYLSPKGEEAPLFFWPDETCRNYGQGSMTQF